MENQGKILDHIKKNPGHTQSQITYRLDIPQSTIKYHLLQLIKENKIFFWFSNTDYNPWEYKM